MPMTRLRDLVRREPRPRVQLPAWIERVVSVGIVSGDGQIVRCQRCVNVGAFAMVATAGSHLITNSLHDFRGLLPINAGNVVMLVGALLVPRMHRFGEHAGAITLLLLILFGHTSSSGRSGLPASCRYISRWQALSCSSSECRTGANLRQPVA